MAKLLGPLCDRIKRQVLEAPVIGVDLTGFSLIEKGGAKKKQVWQLSCPTAIYFEMPDSKKAKDGRDLFIIKEGEKEVFRFSGIAMMDGAPELLAIARELGFLTAACWSRGRATSSMGTRKRRARSLSSSTSSANSRTSTESQLAIQPLATIASGTDIGWTWRNSESFAIRSRGKISRPQGRAVSEFGG